MILALQILSYFDVRDFGEARARQSPETVDRSLECRLGWADRRRSFSIRQKQAAAFLKHSVHSLYRPGLRLKSSYPLFRALKHFGSSARFESARSR